MGALAAIAAAANMSSEDFRARYEYLIEADTFQP